MSILTIYIVVGVLTFLFFVRELCKDYGYVDLGDLTLVTLLSCLWPITYFVLLVIWFIEDVLESEFWEKKLFSCKPKD